MTSFPPAYGERSKDEKMHGTTFFSFYMSFNMKGVTERLQNGRGRLGGING